MTPLNLGELVLLLRNTHWNDDRDCGRAAAYIMDNYDITPKAKAVADAVAAAAAVPAGVTPPAVTALPGFPVPANPGVGQGVSPGPEIPSRSEPVPTRPLMPAHAVENAKWAEPAPKVDAAPAFDSTPRDASAPAFDPPRKSTPAPRVADEFPLQRDPPKKR